MHTTHPCGRALRSALEAGGLDCTVLTPSSHSKNPLSKICSKGWVGLRGNTCTICAENFQGLGPKRLESIIIMIIIIIRRRRTMIIITIMIIMVIVMIIILSLLL